MSILPIRQVSQVTLHCPVCSAQKQVELGLADYSATFYCCKIWNVIALMDRSKPMHPTIKIEFTEVKPAKKSVRPSPDVESWQVEAFSDGESDGFIIVDEYGNEVRNIGFYASRKFAEIRLAEIIEEELDNREPLDPMRGVDFPFADNH